MASIGPWRWAHEALRWEGALRVVDGVLGWWVVAESWVVSAGKVCSAVSWSGSSVGPGGVTSRHAHCMVGMVWDSSPSVGVMGS